MKRNHKHESNDARLRGGLVSSSFESSVMESERRNQPGTAKEQQQKWKSAPEQQKKMYEISQEEVNSAWHRVRAKGGIGGVDGESIKSFEKNLSKNLYKLWNRMSSGSYHPQSVMRVEIPKGDGTMRPLGIPTIIDRVAQEVVRARLEPVMEKKFHQDSYGFRRGKSAPLAVKSCRERCWTYDWVLDVDIQKFFDTIDHEKMMKAVKLQEQESWMELYIHRWLKSSVRHKDGTIEERNQGTPQGGVISPLLANIYLHYTFDQWMKREFSEIKFERYADDIVIHCKTEEQSEQMQKALAERLQECNLKLHPEKTKIVYCKDGQRKFSYATKKFTFLGYTFQPRSAQNQKTKEIYNRFLPAVSTEAGKKFRNKLKKCKILDMRHFDLEKFASELNQRVRGWYGYFSHFYKSALFRMNDWLDCAIVSWLRNKYGTNWTRAHKLLRTIAKRTPKLFAHWHFRIPGRAV